MASDLRRSTPGWLFSPKVDTLAFAGTTLLAVVAIVLGKFLGLWTAPFPTWAWIVLVVFVDVAHVWSTLFRVYLDRRELARRPVLYLAAPLLCYVLGVGVYKGWGSLGFWRALAYVAVWHFVRQQLGWLAIYHRLNRQDNTRDALLDKTVLSLSMLAPLAYWHARTDRAFHWFVEGDFWLKIPTEISAIVMGIFLLSAVVWVLRQLVRANAPGHNRPAKGVWLLLICTAICWNLGIVVLNNDWAFTWSNVLIHGVPYLILLWRYASNRYRETEPVWVAGVGSLPAEPSLATLVVTAGLGAFVLFLATLAIAEEWFWDQLVWHERFRGMFGTPGSYWTIAPDKLQWIVPLLALPQATHYLLDGFVWRNKSNPEMGKHVGFLPTASDAP